MKHLAELIKRAREYTVAYEIKYNVTDEDVLDAIFTSHLAYLINN